MYFLARLEETGLSTWLRETGWVFFGILIIHSLSLALVAGINVAVNLRVLGVGKGIEPVKLTRFTPLLTGALVAVAVSGVLLLLAYPAKALTNWVFYLKLGAIVAALLITRHFFLCWQRGSALLLQASNSTLLAGLALLLWLTGISAGRFLAYTHTVLLASFTY